MSTPLDVPVKSPGAFSSSPVHSPQGSPGRFFHIPSPVITKRTRTYSTSEKAATNPTETGKVKYFCRQKGHGFVVPENGGPDIFVHISDIDGEFVPRQGDEVSYKLCPIPPKNERFQAVHVEIVHLAEGTHERWDNPSSPGRY